MGDMRELAENQGGVIYIEQFEEWIESVVKQLEEQSDYEPIDYDYCDMACSDEQYFIATDKAIEIVKGGGIDG